MTEAEIAAAYRRFGPYVLARCRRILHGEAAAKDALQEVFLRVWRHGAAFAEAQSQLSWLYRVSDRCCFDQLSRRATRAEAARVEDAGVAAEQAGPASASSLEDWDMVRRFLHQLDEPHRQVALLRYLDEMGQEEIAAELGCSRQTVVNRLARIRARAQTFLAQKLCEVAP
jgi:RNA polymerase sigma-70 factor (ECF subfamily)